MSNVGNNYSETTIVNGSRPVNVPSPNGGSASSDLRSRSYMTTNGWTFCQLDGEGDWIPCSVEEHDRHMRLGERISQYHRQQMHQYQYGQMMGQIGRRMGEDARRRARKIRRAAYMPDELDDEDDY